MSEQYVEILVETLQRKKKVLNELIRLNEMQTYLIKTDNFLDDDFDEIVAQKGEQITMLEKLDRGFDSNFAKCRDELLDNKQKYAAQIKTMQDLIKETIDLGSVVYTGEQRNKQMIEAQFTKQRANIKGNRTSSKAAYDYYKTMNHNGMSHNMFMDTKQ